jgi:hypothetical protein
MQPYTKSAPLVVLVLAMTASTFLATSAAAETSHHQHSVVKSEQHVVTRDSNNGNHDTNTHHLNSLSVTQNGENKPKVECEGNWLCEIIGNTVIASLDQDNHDNDNRATSATTALTQSSIEIHNGGSNSDNDEDSNSINSQSVVTDLASTIIGPLFDNHIMIHWSWLGG